MAETVKAYQSTVGSLREEKVASVGMEVEEGTGAMPALWEGVLLSGDVVETPAASSGTETGISLGAVILIVFIVWFWSRM